LSQRLIVKNLSLPFVALFLSPLPVDCCRDLLPPIAATSFVAAGWLVPPVDCCFYIMFYTFAVAVRQLLWLCHSPISVTVFCQHRSIVTFSSLLDNVAVFAASAAS